MLIRSLHNTWAILRRYLYGETCILSLILVIIDLILRFPLKLPLHIYPSYEFVGNIISQHEVSWYVFSDVLRSIRVFFPLVVQLYFETSFVSHLISLWMILFVLHWKIIFMMSSVNLLGVQVLFYFFCLVLDLWR